MKHVKLYTSAGCHLCEEAQAMVLYLQKNDTHIKKNVDLLLIEIADDDQLVESYGIRIPVLTYDEKELGWPFELIELKNWLIKSVI